MFQWCSPGVFKFAQIITPSWYITVAKINNPKLSFLDCVSISETYSGVFFGNKIHKVHKIFLGMSKYRDSDTV